MVRQLVSLKCSSEINFFEHKECIYTLSQFDFFPRYTSTIVCGNLTLCDLQQSYHSLIIASSPQKSFEEFVLLHWSHWEIFLMSKKQLVGHFPVFTGHAKRCLAGFQVLADKNSEKTSPG